MAHIDKQSINEYTKEFLTYYNLYSEKETETIKKSILKSQTKQYQETLEKLRQEEKQKEKLQAIIEKDSKITRKRGVAIC